MSYSPQETFNSDYYLNGLATGKSNYENYQWMPDVTFRMVHHLKYLLGIESNHLVLDYGCARGYVVKAFRALGIRAFGYDISQWAIDNCDDEVKHQVSNDFKIVQNPFDFILAKDVFEHIPLDVLETLVPELLKHVHDSLFVTVPLTQETNGRYVCPRDEMDSSHVIRWTFTDWHSFFLRLAPDDFVVTSATKVPVIKPMCMVYPMSYGFYRIKKYAYK